MPLSVSAETVRAGPATRKRTYDQITRSQSRSQTPTIPAKRRRTDPSESHSSNSSRQPSAQPFPQRFEGDGFDFRRPTASAMAQAEDQTTIDLTLEDNTPPPVLQDLTEDDDNDELSSLFDDSEYVEDLLQIAAPPSNRQQGQNPTEPITISDSEDEDLPADGRPPQPPESPEVQWVGQRPIARRLPSPHPQNLPSLADILRRPSSQPELRRATPPELRRADAQSFRDHLRNVPGAIYDFGRNVFGAAMVPVLPPTTAAFQNFGNLHGNTRFYARNIPTPLDPTIYDDEDDYGAIDLDYHDVGFPMGGLEIIDPVADEAVAALAAEDAYKPPPVPREGFTRDIQEDSDVLICVACEDELATGEDEVKQQVWVAKTCGHVFCGSCASQRLSYRKGNDRDRKRAKRPKVDQLKACKAPNCGSRLTGKTSMFQIYL